MSSEHFTLLTSDDQRALANIKRRFGSLEKVVRALTYFADMPLYRDVCPAVRTPRNFEDIKAAALSEIEISSDPIWNFNPNLVQAAAQSATQNMIQIFETLHSEFQEKYKSRMSFEDFNHATFCLAGLLAAGLIPFDIEGQYDPRFYTGEENPSLPPKPKQPLRTGKGWTVDCFIARFNKWRISFVPDKFVRYPNPILWLEAHMEHEAVTKSFKKPWKGKVDDAAIKVVLEWDKLKSLQWRVQPVLAEYPTKYSKV